MLRGVSQVHQSDLHPPMDPLFCSGDLLVSDCLGVPTLKKILQKFEVHLRGGTDG